jgi:hypothetical protein
MNGARLVITSEHIRAARAMLRWEQKTLAEEWKVFACHGQAN